MYHHLACIYEALGQKDSAWIYVQKSLPYIKTVGQKDRAVFLYMIGENCHRNNENRLAKHYLALSCKAFPTSSAYNLLASISSIQFSRPTGTSGKLSPIRSLSTITTAA